MTTPKPAEPADAGSQTPRDQPPLYPEDYDTSGQPNDQVPVAEDADPPEENQQAAKKAAPVPPKKST